MKRPLMIVGALGLIAAIAVGLFLLRQYLLFNDDPSEETTAPTLEADAESNQVVFRIAKDESLVSFHLQEDLRGTRTDVIGRTNEVAGDILIDFDNPSQSQVGTIRVNARTLATDNSFRNRAINTDILETRLDEYEFSEFVPTEIRNFPENPEIGQALTFQIVGNLTVKASTNEVVFDVTVTMVSEDRMEGTATTQVLRSDYDLNIPDAPGVANVTNEVDLTIQFVALAVDEASITDTVTE